MTLLEYEHVTIQECGEPLVEINAKDFVLSPEYFKRGFSSSKRMFTRSGVLERLLRAQKRLKSYRFKIFDPYRSRAVQAVVYQRYWQELKSQLPALTDEELKLRVGVFVSDPYNPERIPPHSTGGAVDLTLVDSEGKELDMGTDFDHFGPAASALFFEAPFASQIIRDNRRRLRDALQEEQFRFLADEWWHFDYGTQLWAVACGAPRAVYGEMLDPEGR